VVSGTLATASIAAIGERIELLLEGRRSASFTSERRLLNAVRRAIGTSITATSPNRTDLQDPGAYYFNETVVLLRICKLLLDQKGSRDHQSGASKGGD
jgi:hypothetical protein